MVETVIFFSKRQFVIIPFSNSSPLLQKASITIEGVNLHSIMLPNANLLAAIPRNDTEKTVRDISDEKSTLFYFILSQSVKYLTIDPS